VPPASAQLTAACPLLPPSFALQASRKVATLRANARGSAAGAAGGAASSSSSLHPSASSASASASLALGTLRRGPPGRDGGPAGGRSSRMRKLQDVLAYELGAPPAGSGGGGAPSGSGGASGGSASGGALFGLPPFAGNAEAAEHYVAAAMGRPTLPPRPFCSVCGFAGKYACTRCGARFCSGKCREHHAETRCARPTR
jgi:hypothetical protein